MENRNINGKESLKNFLFLLLLGTLIVTFKYYIIRRDSNNDACSNINSELDMIKCLDAYAINSDDFREPLSYTKILLYSSIVIIFFIIICRFINNNVRRNNYNVNIILQRIHKFIFNLINKGKIRKKGL